MTYFKALSYAITVLVMTSACGGYEAADPKDLQAGTGQFVGVLLDDKGKASPDAFIQLIAADGTELLHSDNMDSDGSFSVYPPEPGLYNLIGSFGDTKKGIKQNIELDENLSGVNVGTIQASTVAGFGFQVQDSEGNDLIGAMVEVLGTPVSGETIAEGYGAVAGVPAGIYTIRFRHDGYVDKPLSEVSLESASAIDLGQIVMEAE